MAESWESNLFTGPMWAIEIGRTAGTAERAGAGVDAESCGADLRVASGRLAGSAEEFTVGGRRSARANAQAAGDRRKDDRITEEMKENASDGVIGWPVGLVLGAAAAAVASGCCAQDAGPGI